MNDIDGRGWGVKDGMHETDGKDGMGWDEM